MISDNVVDLTGFAYNVMSKEYDTHTSIYFTLNIGNRFIRNGSYVTEYDVVSCVINSNKDQQGNHNKSFEYFNKNVVDGQIIRLQGRVTSYTEGIINGELVTINSNNRDQASKLITRNMIRVSDYKFIETKEQAIKRIDFKKNRTNHIEKQNENQQAPSEKVDINKPVENSQYEETIEQGEMPMQYFPDFEVPQYKNMDM